MRDKITQENIISKLWTRKIPETKETRTTCTNKYLYLMILGYNLSLFWSSDSISVRCVFVDLWLIQRAVGLDLGWTVGSFFKWSWAWSLKVDLSGSSRSRWGLILRMSVSSRAVEAWSWITVMSGSSRAFGLDLEEQWWTDLQGLLGLILKKQWWTDLQGLLGLILKNGWMCGFVDVVDPKGRWGLILDERMMNDGAFFKGRRGLILKERWTKNEERRELSWFFGNLDAWELRSFRASELQEFCLMILVPPPNEWNGLVFIEFSKA